LVWKAYAVEQKVIIKGYTSLLHYQQYDFIFIGLATTFILFKIKARESLKGYSYGAIFDLLY